VSVKAEWHTPELVAALDPDELFGPAERIEDVGTPIVLDAAGELAELQRELTETLTAENRLYGAGVTCKIKDSADTSCHACPLYRADGSPHAELCAIGRRQERICTAIVVHHHGG
jgi:hypothetical protein